MASLVDAKSYFAWDACITFGCGNRRSSPGISLHKLPKNKKMRDLWLSQLRLKTLPDHTKPFVCSSHFEPNCYTVFNKYETSQGQAPIIRLSGTAVPTLLLHGESVSMPETGARNFSVRRARGERKKKVIKEALSASADVVEDIESLTDLSEKQTRPKQVDTSKQYTSTQDHNYTKNLPQDTEGDGSTDSAAEPSQSAPVKKKKKAAALTQRHRERKFPFQQQRKVAKVVGSSSTDSVAVPSQLAPAKKKKNAAALTQRHRERKFLFKQVGRVAKTVGSGLLICSTDMSGTPDEGEQTKEKVDPIPVSMDVTEAEEMNTADLSLVKTEPEDLVTVDLGLVKSEPGDTSTADESENLLTAHSEELNVFLDGVKMEPNDASVAEMSVVKVELDYSSAEPDNVSTVDINMVTIEPDINMVTIEPNINMVTIEPHDVSKDDVSVVKIEPGDWSEADASVIKMEFDDQNVSDTNWNQNQTEDEDEDTRSCFSEKEHSQDDGTVELCLPRHLDVKAERTADCAGIALSHYATSLDSAARESYNEKISSLGEDPYCVCHLDLKSVLECSYIELPNVEYPDVFHYLVGAPGYSIQDMKSYKSSGGYTCFIAGLVRDMLVTCRAEHFVIFSKVLDSEPAMGNPSDLWLITHQDGRVLHAHCDCLADGGSVCTHIAATLFAVDCVVRMKREASAGQCGRPSAFCPAQLGTPCPGADIDFTSNSKRRKLSGCHFASTPLSKPTEAEAKTFYDALAESGTNSVILSAIPGYSNNITNSTSQGLPAPLSTLFQPRYKSLNFEQLVEEAKEIFVSMSITPEQAAVIEVQTKGQDASQVLTEMRAGRIPASLWKAATTTHPGNSSESLIKEVCYPDKMEKAASWRCEHVTAVLAAYETQHCEFSVTDAGLFINPEFPHLTASPHALVTCSCCGDGVCLVQCQRCHGEEMEEVLVTKKLKKYHRLYHQIQAELHISQKRYCDFVFVKLDSVHVERFQQDADFWDKSIKKASDFYVLCILPELLARWYISRICYCGEFERGDVVECRASTCKVKRFHVACLGLKKASTTWRCLECRTFAKAKKNKRA